MSAAEDDDDDLSPFSVGYSKPPEEHRFKKGRSGNPKGRPKKARQLRPSSRNLLGSDEPTTRMILELGSRPVRVRGANGTTDMPVNEAIIIAMQQKTLQGDRNAQRDYLNMTRSIERDQRSRDLEYFSEALDYKLAASREIARCKKLGIDPPTFLPHPEDIEIDPRNGTVLFLGPVPLEEKRGWDLMLARRDEVARNVSRIARRHKRLRNPAEKMMALKEWVDAQELFDLLNDPLPPRYKTSLGNRTDLDSAH
jgi:hypothetical protein